MLKGFLLLFSIAQIAADFKSIGIEQAPWQASVQINDKHHCGGVIYSEDIILTIAECVRKARLEFISVRVGSAQENAGGTVLKVKKMRLQVLGLRPNDVAILLLRSPLYLHGGIQAIPLATEPLVPGTNASVTGWGQLSALNPSSKVLLRVDVQIQDQLMCATNNAMKGRLISVGEICAAPAGEIPYACQGFVGGPLVADNRLYGMLSWQSACDVLSKSNAYANIAMLKMWIESTVKLINFLGIG
ncbi:trypsin alpha [Drosophila sechellia]|uniref:trypsin n=1 Tax=Drosophila sechellia TaxID=7238 RepID=B4I2I0_DROSE|nr:trypsin alpha [Drosophila sechellia]EDW53975.1 GM18242 [Drosophila sechellia]